MFVKLVTCLLLSALVVTKCQVNIGLPLSPDSFRQIFRTLTPVPEGRKMTLNDTRIIFYNGTSTDQTVYGFDNATLLLSNPKFDVNKPTVMYVFGYVEYANDFSVLHVVEAYLKRGDYNVLVLDWSNYAFGNYLSVTLDVKMVGEAAGSALTRVVQKGLDVKRLHLVGHSAGAQVASAAARVLKQNGYPLSRLTSLDPAYPGFYPPLQLSSDRIGPEDADFVDIIHTDSGKFGAPFNTGHADFWPNGGRAPQPGCPPVTILLTSENFCSHWRSWRFWAESVAGGAFVARKSTSYYDFLDSTGNGTALMGFGATPDLRGDFYLRTASKEPFALGERGAS